ncbi:MULTISPECIES: hypothetical protein [Methanoculleus]|uniref:DUF4386 family protein n=2 Tax=Methanoculleus TaxID=45989 RepID=A3CTU5_METMJ|nr:MULTISPECIES: hypothetical protein [Methanoculleus]ABN56795.1 conserved hypothetical protein [Methanoculleus marisnigri JR1]MCC7556420.1 hypothetical protein [Methanoculleus marisnigri]UYU18223.1 hypothetical protein OH143_11025 [Methanoculleus submarinus]
MTRTLLAALSLAVAGACFFAYPAIRPYTDETSLAGAGAFASPAWLLSHTLAIVGFILLVLGLLGLYDILRETKAEPRALAALVLTWVGVGLVLPYYGAETFALNAVGRQALQQNSIDLLVTLTDAIRFGEGVWLFGAGLLALAAGSILFATAIWRSGTFPRWSGIPLALGFALFLPQFFTPPAVRIAHGLLVMVGCWLVAWNMIKRR